jgi:hypothetical protein
MASTSRSSATRALCGAAVFSILVVLCLGTDAAAQPQASPYFELGQLACLDGGVLRSYPPRIMRSTRPTNFRDPEEVRWKPYLYRYNPASGKWRLIQTRSWYRAYTSSNGFFQDAFGGNGWTSIAAYQGQVLFVPFTGLGPGRYKIKNFLYWGWQDRTYYSWSGGACTFR